MASSTLTTTQKPAPAVQQWPGVGEYGFVPTDSIVPSPYNPRKYFDENEIDLLAVSIADGDQREIATVRPLTQAERKSYRGARYMLTSGERRWRAAKKAGKAFFEIRVKLYASRGKEMLDAYMLNENRQPISDIENAWYIQGLANEFGWKTQAEIAAGINKDQVYVSQMLALLKCTPKVQERMHPRITPEQRLGRQVGVLFSKLPPETQDDLIERMPKELDTAVAQIQWIRREVGDRGISLPTRRRDPIDLRRNLQGLARAVFDKVHALRSSAELKRAFENTSKGQSLQLMQELRRAFGEFDELIREVEELSRGENRMTAPKHLIQGRNGTGQPVRRPAEERVTIERWDDSISRFITDNVTLARYAEYWDKGMLKFQRQKLPKPAHYIDRSTIIGL